jgi:hypothetical protein
MILFDIINILLICIGGLGVLIALTFIGKYLLKVIILSIDYLNKVKIYLVRLHNIIDIDTK